MIKLRRRRKPLDVPPGYVIKVLYNPDWSPQYKGVVCRPSSLIHAHKEEDVSVERVRRACQRWAIQDAERRRIANNWTEI